MSDLLICFLCSQDVVLQKGVGPLGLSIVGGSDHSCIPFGVDEPGVFISKVVGSRKVFFPIFHR